MDIKKVLVAVDFSPVSIHALHSGVALARKFHAKLSVLHVVELPSVLLYAFPGEAEQIASRRKNRAQKLLPGLIGAEDRNELRAQFFVRTGEITEVIESVVHEEEADLLVVGSHGRGLFARLLLGSVTEALLRRLGVPVLTVSPTAKPLQFDRILFATDFGVDSHKAFRQALEFAAATHSTLVVAHALEAMSDREYASPQDCAEFEEERTRRLAHIHDRFDEYRAEGAARKVRVDCTLAEGAAAAWLVRLADRHAIDLMILGLRKKGSLERAILGSTAEPVIRGGHVPVLCLPIDTPEAVVRDRVVDAFRKQLSHV